MSFRLQRLLIPAALLLTASLALAAPPAPEAPQAPAAIAAPAPAQPLAVLSTAGPVCKGADLPIFSPEPQAKAETCGACSDAACVGKNPNAVCGPAGFRCIAGSPTCTAAPAFRCRCLLI